MTLEIRSGNTTKFDIDAIRMAVSGGGRDVAFGQTNAALPENFNAQHEALINDITDMIDELQSNMNAGAGNELESMISRIAGRLMVPGLSSAASNAIMLEVERRDGKDGRVFSAEEWNKIKEDVEKERKEQAKIADMADDANNTSQRMTPQQWDEAPSSDYPGMKNAEVLQMLRRINSNLPFYSQLAVQKGLIKPEEQVGFEAFLKKELWLKEQERLGKIDTPEYKEAKRQQDAEAIKHPTYRTAATQVAQEDVNLQKVSDNRMEDSSPGKRGALFGDTAEYQGLNNDEDVRAGMDKRVTQQSDNYQISTNLSGTSADAGRLATSPSRDVEGGIQAKASALTGNFNIQSGATPVNAPVSTANEPSVQLAQSTVAPPIVLPVRTNMI